MFKLNKSVSIKIIASELGFKFSGDGDFEVKGVCSLDNVCSNALTFSKGIDPISNNSAVISLDTNDSSNKLISENPRFSFIRTIEWLESEIGFVKSNSAPNIHSTVKIGNNAVISENVTIGKNCVIEPNVTILSGTIIGENCLIRANAVIGSDGFGYERMEDGTPVKFIHLGGVVIGDNVEIGSCTCIAKGTLSNTIIEDDVKIDNLVHVAHNCIIRKGAFIIASSVLCGGVDVGENTWVAPNATVTQKAHLGKNSLVGLGAVVTKNVDPDCIVAGNPAKVLRKK